MAETIPAVYENGVFHPLQPLGLQEHQRVYLLVIPEDPAALVASQRQALADLAGMGSSGRSDISAAHDSYLYRKD
jgi:predicted DNA-binding antitoxin AbrB/MazE fold protein